MANEHQKLREAAYFLGVMKSNVGYRNAFIYNFSAFMSAARSVAQYAHKECESKSSSSKQWYDQHVSATTEIRYFKDKRDLNVHEEPVTPNQVHGITATTTLFMSVTVDVTVVSRDAVGNRVEESTPASKAAEAAIAKPTTNHTVRYFLEDRKDEDLIDLAEKYLNELVAFVGSGQVAGHLT